MAQPIELPNRPGSSSEAQERKKSVHELEAELATLKQTLHDRERESDERDKNNLQRQEETNKTIDQLRRELSGKDAQKNADPQVPNDTVTFPRRESAMSQKSGSVHLFEKGQHTARKEADTIRIQNPPTSTNWESWFAQLTETLVAASPLINAESLIVPWIIEVNTVTKIEELGQTPVSLKSLDAKLANALGNVIKGDTKQEVERQRTKSLYETKKLLTGRRMLFIIRSFLKSKDSAENMYAVSELVQVEWTSDENAQKFLLAWDKQVPRG